GALLGIDVLHTQAGAVPAAVGFVHRAAVLRPCPRGPARPDRPVQGGGDRFPRPLRARPCWGAHPGNSMTMRRALWPGAGSSSDDTLGAGPPSLLSWAWPSSNRPAGAGVVGSLGVSTWPLAPEHSRNGPAGDSSSAIIGSAYWTHQDAISAPSPWRISSNARHNALNRPTASPCSHQRGHHRADRSVPRATTARRYSCA